MATGNQQTAGPIVGLAGGLLIVASVIGASMSLDSGPAPAVKQPEPTAAVAQTVKTAPEPVATVAPEPVPQVSVVPHYPLQVGRYWVYRHQEPGSDVVSEIERVIVRRKDEADGRQLFIFDDGGVVYFEDGRVFEMGASGGVNIIPVDTAGAPPPVIYRSQGMQIEKWVGAVDTSLVVSGHRFDDCLEVVTRFRAVDEPDRAVSYSSFYAPGIGMVGRQTWPRDERGSLAVTLADHGTRRL